jgi:hypothetical protein
MQYHGLERNKQQFIILYNIHRTSKGNASSECKNNILDIQLASLQQAIYL